jgi:hypothetical protein
MSPSVQMPDSAAYLEAVQHPPLCFKDATLKASMPDLDKLGLPRPISGNFACVFTLAEPSKRRWAVKCFTKSVDDRRERYQAVSNALASAAVPWKVHFEYQDPGILAQGKWWPLVKMEWFEAEVLSAWVVRHQYEPDRLWKVAEQICAVVSDLERLGWSHGDLQHGNILVAGDDSIRLIDYDGMFVPALAGRKPTESGHLHYQHPSRVSQGFGPHLDRFSGWVIALGLAAIAHEPTLVAQNPDSKESILFRADDYKSPASSSMLRSVAQSPAARSVGECALKVMTSNLQTLAVPTLRDLPRPKKGASVWATPAAASTQAASAARPAGATGSATSISWPPPPPRPTYSAAPTAPLGASSWLPPGAGASSPNVQRTAAEKFSNVGGARFLWLLALLVVAVGPQAALWPFLGAAALACWLLLTLVGWLRAPERQQRRVAQTAVVKRQRELDAARARHGKTLVERQELITTLNAFYSESIHQMDLARAKHHDEIKSIQANLATRLSEIETLRRSAEAKTRSDYEAVVRKHRDAQLDVYLAKQPVSLCSIPASSVQALRRAGISTAADFIGMRLESTSYGNGTRALMQFTGGHYRHVPSIGPVRARELVLWRDALVRRAPTAPDPVKEKQRLDQELRTTTQRLEQEKATTESAAAAQLLQPTQGMTTYNTRLAELRKRLAVDERTLAAIDARLVTEDAAEKSAAKDLTLATDEAAQYRGLTLRFFVRQTVGTTNRHLVVRSLARVVVLAAVAGAAVPAVQV